MHRPLVKLVEQNSAHPGKRRIGLEASGQDSFGDDLHPCIWAYSSVITGAPAHRVANRFAKQFSHPTCDRACGNPSGFQHENLARSPRFVQQSEWHDGRLAGSRLGGEDRGVNGL